MPRLLLALLALLLPGCSSSAGHDGSPTLTVLAAASLAGVLDPLQAELRRTHPGVTVRLSYGGSPSLVAQVRNGSPADVLITASPGSITPLVDDRLVGTPVSVATNTVVLVVPSSNPGHVTALADLARRSLRVALCDPSVPCGSAAATTLSAAHVTAAPDTLAPDVKTVLRLVQTGEADAGIVYVTDARAAGSAVRTIPLPPGTAASTSYPAAVVTSSGQQALARAYVDLLRSAVGQSALRGAGFGPP